MFAKTARDEIDIPPTTMLPSDLKQIGVPKADRARRRECGLWLFDGMRRAGRC
jgi:hypothetical protein